VKKLSLLGEKGGCGKSTVATGLAVAASQAGIETAIIDLDPQATASKWSDRRGKEFPAVVSCQVSRLAHVLDAAEQQGAQLAIIDTPGKSTDAAIAAAKVADFVLMPIHPQMYDIKSDYRGDQIDLPTKKPRKSQKNPNPPLSDEQRAANTALSRVRIFIEHAIGGMKRYNILVHGFRHRKTHFEDNAIGVCAGLWNFVLSY
jgi:cellulose biosynthesis protein BcsQ